MRRLIERAMSSYDQSDLHLKMKARFFFGICLVLLALITIVIIYTTIFQLHSPETGYRIDFRVLLPALACSLVAASAFILLIRGRFSISAHLILFGTMVALWTSMFLDRSPIIARLDSIVLCIGLLSMTPLAVTRYKSATILYAFLNIVLLFGYAWHIRAQLPIPNYIMGEYLADATVAFVFISITTYSTFAINHRALNQAAAEIHERRLAEATVNVQKEELEAINRELTGTVEKMAITTREYEEANVRLIEAQQEILNANALLKESEEKFSKAFHLSPLMISLITFPEGRFVDVSDNFCYAVEFSREEMIGHTPHDLSLLENASDFDSIMDILTHKISVLDEEIVIHSRSGKRLTLLISAEVISIAHIPHAIIVGIDITERKEAEDEKIKLEAQLRQAQKMESIGRLAGGVAHDFNNLLTAILGNTDLALMELEDDNPLHPRLTVVMQAAQSAADLTRQLLAFSRKQIIEPEPVDLAKLIEDMHMMLARLIGEDIRLDISAPRQLGLIKADHGLIEQIIVNLVVNARDAMPEGGRLVLEVADQHLDDEYVKRHPYTKPGEYVMLAVSDTGCGMAAEVKQHIFEPFFTTKPLGKGTGLGLATSYGAVKQHGGSIEVYSEPGHGTTFKIYFPRLMEEVTRLKEPTRSEEIPGGTETILLVEDDPGVLDFSLGVLEHLGYQMLAAASGEIALALAEAHPTAIHLLITDVIMPGMNGRILADRLVSKRPDLRVLFSSGYTENVIVHHGVLEEGINFLGKPFTALSLARKVRDVLDRAVHP
ncbi:MAG: ATP-binding protein [Syntrophaceae bacterium]